MTYTLKLDDKSWQFYQRLIIFTCVTTETGEYLDFSPLFVVSVLLILQKVRRDFSVCFPLVSIFELCYERATVFAM